MKDLILLPITIIIILLTHFIETITDIINSILYVFRRK